MIKSAPKPYYFVILFLFLGAAIFWAYSQSALKHFGVDFAAYYVAGKAVLERMDIYLFDTATINGLPFYHSNFVYPPIVALPFGALALLPYTYSRLIWFAFQIIVYLLTIIATCEILKPAKKTLSILVLTVAGALTFPFYAEIERGQIDLLTLLLLMGSLWFWINKKNPTVAGILLGLAAIIKPPILFMLVVPLVYRNYKIIWSAVVTLAVMVGLSLAIYSAPKLAKITGLNTFQATPLSKTCQARSLRAAAQKFI